MELVDDRVIRLKDAHKGERCFILGLGPSLNKTPLHLLKDEIVFGVNGFYKKADELKVHCQYYGISDVHVWTEGKEQIVKLPTTLFLSGFAAYYQEQHPIDIPIPHYIIKEIGQNHFSKDITQGLYNGQTVIYDICLQVAYYMGFEKVYLLGCDCDYTGMHHFDGTKANNMSGGAIGNWDRVFHAYRLAKQIYEEDGREIINATVGGKLEIFKRDSLENII